MNFIKLTRTGFKSFESVYVNADRITMVTPAQQHGAVVWFGKSSVDVCESPEQIAALLKPAGITTP